MSLESVDCTQPGCDRRALPGAALCGPHLDDQKQNREHVWSGSEELPLLQTSPVEEVAAPAPKKRRGSLLRQLDEVTDAVQSRDREPAAPAVPARARIRSVQVLRRRFREAAAQLVALDEAVQFYRAQHSLARFLEERGEPVRVVDLAEASRTLRIYAGFLQLAASAAERTSTQTATSD